MYEFTAIKIQFLLRDKTQYLHQENELIFTVEITTRCSFVIEFIIPKFIEGST
jgi:hypothetical protein